MTMTVTGSLLRGEDGIASRVVLQVSDHSAIEQLSQQLEKLKRRLPNRRLFFRIYLMRLKTPSPSWI